MYVPLDISRYTQKPVIFAQLLATNIYPTQTTDPNIIYNVNSEEFKFTHLDQLYEPNYALRIARTPSLQMILQLMLPFQSLRSITSGNFIQVVVP